VKTQFTRFFVVASLVLLPVASTKGSSIEPNASAQSSRTASASLDWIDLVMQFLEVLYQKLGGDPAKLREQASLPAKFGLIADQYASSGVPTGLEGPELAALAASIQQLYTLLSAPPPGLVLHTESFRRVLRLIWIDLGLPPEELG
jgi:hypothetical protein